MVNFRTPVISVKKKGNGWNYISGKIVNFKDYKDAAGKMRNTSVNVYFVDSFYVASN